MTCTRCEHLQRQLAIAESKLQEAEKKLEEARASLLRIIKKYEPHPKNIWEH